MKRLAIVIIAILLAIPATAGEYTFSEGYWWQGSNAYTRTLVESPGYYTYSGCYRYYYPGTSSYSYTFHHARAVPTDWRTQLLELAKQRDKLVLAERRAALEQKYYLEAIGALGLTGNFRVEGYGPAVGYGYGGVNATANLYTGGNSVFGYTYQTVKEAYGSTDMNSLYQQSARLTQGAQGLATQANTEFSSLVQQAGDNQARVAEILARAQAAALALQATAPSPSTRETTTVTGTATGLATDADAGTVWQKSAQARCAACHAGARIRGGFDLNKFASLDDAGRHKVWVRLTTADLTKRMPRDVKDEHKPGVQLGPDELMAWARVLVKPR
jgi:mono/diheme cytochrome c family protein